MNIIKVNRSVMTRYIALSLMTSVSALSTAVAAQEEEKAYAGLEEIVITASKREETLQEAGMSVTAIGAQDLERMGVTSFTDFAVRVPNLGFGNESDGRFNANSPSIRGVFGDNTTGFYIDDTPLPASIQPRVIDISRIEVLRGPQGSLYGARSMGGTIRLITQQPEFDETSGSVHATLSSVKEGDQNWSVDGSVNIPVIKEKLAVRATAYYGQNSGIFDREYVPSWVNAQTGATVLNTAPAFDRNENVDDETYGGFQLVAKAKLSENLTFTPKIMYQKIDADGLPFADVSPDNFTQARFFDTEEPGSDEWWLTSGTFNWDLDNGSITSTTSYFDRFIDEREEEASFLHFLLNVVIEVPLDPLESPIDENEKFTSFVHETRYTSSFDGPLQVTAGVFYQRNKNRLRYDPPALQIGLDAAFDAAVGGPAGFAPGDLIYSSDNFFNTKEYAIFGELTYDITDALSITAGGRYYDTKTDAMIDSDGFANGGPTHIEGEQAENGFNPKVLVQFNVNEELDLYASASKGYRIGGVNGNISETLCGADLAALGVNRADVETFDSDSLWSYEAGAKSKLADNRVSVNVSGYYIKWSNISQQNRLACGFQFIDNAGAAEIKGFEAEITAAPIDGLTLTFATGYANSKISDDGGVAGVAVGDRIQGVPDWTVSASGEYIFPLSGSTDGLVRADFNYYGLSYSANNEAVTPRARPSWNVLNLRAGIIRDDWEMTVFMSNVTNEHNNLADSRSIAAETPGRQRLVTNRPRTIDIDFRKRF